MKFKLGERVSFDKSPIWEIQTQYYKNNGKNSWKKGQTPFNITSNSRFAYQTAKIIYENIKNINLEKIYILELGSGVGLFAKYFLDQLKKICYSKNKELFKRIHFMITDYSVKNLNDIIESKVFDEYKKSGNVDFYTLDINNPENLKNIDGIELKIENNMLSAVIANYLYCVIPYKTIKKEQDKYYEKYVQLYINSDSEVSIDELFKNVTEIDYQSIIEKEIHYKEIYLSESLGINNAEFLKKITNDKSEFILDYSPISINSLDNFLRLLNEQGVFLISDKASNEFSSYYSKENDYITHSNSLSYMPNLPMFGKFAEYNSMYSKISKKDYSFKTLMIKKVENKNIIKEFDKLFVTTNINAEIIEVYKKGRNYLKNNKIKDAIEEFKLCYKHLPEDAWLIYSLASAYLATSQIDNALKISYKGYELDYFKLFGFSIIIGFCYLNLGEYKKARDFFLEAIKEDGYKDNIVQALEICNKQLMIS